MSELTAGSLGMTMNESCTHDWTERDERAEGVCSICQQAEIDSLRAENATQDKRIVEWGDRYADLSNETDRLHAENAELLSYLNQIRNLVQTAPSQFFQHRASQNICTVLESCDEFIAKKTAKEGE